MMTPREAAEYLRNVADNVTSPLFSASLALAVEALEVREVPALQGDKKLGKGQRLTYQFGEYWQIAGAGGAPCDVVCDSRGLSGCHDCPIQTAFDRLAAYEDTMPFERAQELAQAEKDGRLVAYMPGDKVYDRFGTPWIVKSSEIHLIGEEIKHLYRCGHPGTEDYRALYEEEIRTRKGFDAALKKREADNEAD